MDELEIDGKKYISSRRAAKEHKYHIDYIGQLIRAGKVVGKKVGRSWYVEASSLKSYLASEKSGAPQKEEVEVVKEAEPIIEEKLEVIEAPQVIVEPIVKEKIEEPVQETKPGIVEEKFERAVHITVPTPLAPQKKGTLIYMGDDEPMLPNLQGRVRTNADFVPIAMRKVVEPEEETFIEAPEEVREVEEKPLQVRRKKFSLPRAQVLAVVAVMVLAVVAVTSSVLATSIKVSDGGAASVGLTIK
jgi:hypothetical protein